MKLSDTSPQQHLAILVLAGLFIFINTLQAVKESLRNEDGDIGPQQKYANSFDPMSGQMMARETKYKNPSLSWYEWIFCRGMKRSSSCSYKMLHPFTEDSASLGVDVPDGEPKKDHVVYYRGNLNKGTFSGSVEAPEAASPPPNFLEAE